MFICATCIKLLFASKCNYSKHFILQTQMSRIETNQNDLLFNSNTHPEFICAYLKNIISNEWEGVFNECTNHIKYLMSKNTSVLK